MGCGVVSGVPCFWGCWLMHRYRGMNAPRTSVSLVRLLTLSTDQIHPFTVFDQVFQKMTILLYLYKWKNVQRHRDRRVSALYACEEWYDTPREVSSMFFRDVIRHDNKDFCAWRLRSVQGWIRDQGRQDTLIHEIIPCRRGQGVIRIKIIVVNVLNIGCWQANAWDSNLAFTNQFLLQTMLPLLSRSTRDGCKDRPNDLFAFGVRRPARLAALASQRWHEWRQCWWILVLSSLYFYYWRSML